MARDGTRTPILKTVKRIREDLIGLSQQLTDSPNNRAWFSAQLGDPPWFDAFVREVDEAIKGLGFVVEAAGDGPNATAVRSALRYPDAWAGFLGSATVANFLSEPMNRVLVLVESHRIEKEPPSVSEVVARRIGPARPKVAGPPGKGSTLARLAFPVPGPPSSDGPADPAS